MGKKKFASVYLKKVLTNTTQNWNDVDIGNQHVNPSTLDARCRADDEASTPIGNVVVKPPG